MISEKDRLYMRELAKQVKEIADNDIWKEKIYLWQKFNKLESVRPMVMNIITDECWPELIGGKDLKMEDPFLKSWEYYLKKKIYRWENVRDDIVTTDKIYVPIDYAFTEWAENRIRPFAANNRPYESDGKTAAAFHPCILEYDDWDKLVKKPELKYIDWKKSEQDMNILVDLFGDILDVRQGEPFYSSIDTSAKGWGLSGIDILCELRGLENIMYDLYDEPDFVHMAMKFLCDGLNDYLDTLEKENLLRLNNNEFLKNANTPLGSNGLSISDELPGNSCDVNHVRTQDLWGYCQAQEFAPVSAEMLNEFVLPYQKPLADRFGMIAYGCCEPNDFKYDCLMNTFSNLRQISVCHVADIRLAAEKIKDKYTISWKPHCTLIDNFNEQKVRSFMEEGFEVFKDCHVVCSLRDNLTLHGANDSFTRWTNIAMEIAERYHK